MCSRRPLCGSLHVSSVYTKEYRSLTKQMERDWLRKRGIELVGFRRKHQLPPMIGSLYHLLQLLILCAVLVVVFYALQLSELEASIVILAISVCANQRQQGAQTALDAQETSHYLSCFVVSPTT